MSVFLVEAIGQIKAILERIQELQRGPPEEHCLVFQEYVSMLNGEPMKAIAEASIYYSSELKQLQKEDLDLDVSSPNFLRSRERSRRQRALLKKRQEDSEAHGLRAGKTEVEIEVGEGGIKKEGETAISETHDVLEKLFSGAPRSTSASSLLPSISFFEELYETNAQIQHSWGLVLSIALKSQPEEEEYHESIVEDYENLFECPSSYLRAWLLKSGNGSSITDIIYLFQSVNGYVTADVVTSAFHQVQTPQKLKDLKGVLNCMKECHIPVTVRIAGLLEKALVRCMKSEGAEKVYHFMVSDCSLTPLTTRPFALLFNDKNVPVSRVLNYYDEMLDYGIKPELSTLRLLCNKCKNDSKWIRTHFTLLSITEDERNHAYSHKLEEKGPIKIIPNTLLSVGSHGGPIESDGVDNHTHQEIQKTIRTQSQTAILFFVNRLSVFAAEHGLSIVTTGDLVSKTKNESSLPSLVSSTSDVASSLPSMTENGDHSSSSPDAASGGVSLLDAMRILHRCEVEGRSLRDNIVLVSNLLLLVCAGTSTPVEDLVLPFSESKAYYPARVWGGMSPPSPSSSVKTGGASHFGLSPALHPSFDEDGREPSLHEGRHSSLQAGVRSSGAAGDTVPTTALGFHPEANATKRPESENKDGVRGLNVDKDIQAQMSSGVGEWGKDDGGEREPLHSRLATRTIPTDPLAPHSHSSILCGTPPPPVSPLSHHSDSEMATVAQEVLYVLDVMREHFQWEMTSTQVLVNLFSAVLKRNFARADDVVEILLLYHFRRNRMRCAEVMKKLALPTPIAPQEAYVWVSPTPCKMCRFVVDRHPRYNYRMRARKLLKEVLQQYFEFTAVYHLNWDVVKCYRFPASRHDGEENENEGEGKEDTLHDVERADSLLLHSLDSSLRTPHYRDATPHSPQEDASHFFSPSSVGEGGSDSTCVSTTVTSANGPVSKNISFWGNNSRSVHRFFVEVMRSWRSVSWCLGLLVAGFIISDAPLPKEMEKWLVYFHTCYTTHSEDGGVPTDHSVEASKEEDLLRGEDKDESSVPMHRDANSFDASSSHIPHYILVIDELIRCEWRRETIFQSPLLMYGQENSSTANGSGGGGGVGHENGVFASHLSRGPTSAGLVKTEAMTLEEERDEKKKESEKGVNIEDHLWDSVPAVSRESTSSVSRNNHGQEGEPEIKEGQGDPAILHQRIIPETSTIAHTSVWTSAGGARERPDSARRTLEYYLQSTLRDLRMPNNIIDWYRKRLFSIASELSRSSNLPQ